MSVVISTSLVHHCEWDVIWKLSMQRAVLTSIFVYLHRTGVGSIPAGDLHTCRIPLTCSFVRIVYDFLSKFTTINLLDLYKIE